MWHASIANHDLKRGTLNPVRMWTRRMHVIAEKILLDTLDGAGGEWQRWEEGDLAKHVRRRLSPAEMGLLFGILPSAPVFTHGKALELL